MAQTNPRKISLNYVLILAIILVSVYFFYFLKLSPTGFAVYDISSQSEFDEGIYQNTTHNGSEIVLSEGNISGHYISKIFGSDADAIWNSLTWQGEQPSTELIFLSDIKSDIWQSIDSGVTWTKTNDDYNGAAANGGNDMAKDSSNTLFLIDNQDLWSSTDSGITWTKINDDFNIADSNSGLVLSIDSNDNIYIVDSSEDIYKSTDSGATFTNIATNFNGINGNVFGISNFISNSQLSFQVKNCSQADCSDGTWQNNDLDNINLISKYFQYKISFSSPIIKISPAVESVSIDYDILCAESWTAEYTSCSISDQKVKYYIDENSCGTANNLPLDNGTIESCDYCSSAWENLNSSCQIDDSFIVGYVYTNSCCAETGLISDCNMPTNTTIACDYCTQNLTSANSTCQSDNTLTETFTDLNNCYSSTNLESDRITGQIIHNCTYIAPSSPSSGGRGGKKSSQQNPANPGTINAEPNAISEQVPNKENENAPNNIEPKITGNAGLENNGRITGRVIAVLNERKAVLVTALTAIFLTAYLILSIKENRVKNKITKPNLSSQKF